MSDETWGVPGITHWDGCGEIGTPEHAGCFISMDKQTTMRVPPERAILQDLIAELREAHDLACDGCGDGYPCSTGDAYGRAEARLREAMRNDE